MESLFENTTLYTKELLKEAQKTYLRRFNRKLMLFFLIGGIALLALAVLGFALGVRSIFAGRETSLVLPLLAFVLGAAFIVTYAFPGGRAGAMQYRSLVKSGLLEPQLFAFSDGGFAVASAHGSATIYWNQCSGAAFTQNVCILVLDKLFYLVDLRGFTKGDAQSFYAFVGQHVPIK